MLPVVAHTTTLTAVVCVSRERVSALQMTRQLSRVDSPSDSAGITHCVSYCENALGNDSPTRYHYHMVISWLRRTFVSLKTCGITVTPSQRYSVSLWRFFLPDDKGTMIWAQVDIDRLPISLRDIHVIHLVNSLVIRAVITKYHFGV